LEVLEPQALLSTSERFCKAFRMAVSTPKQPEAVDKFENICHVVQTEQHRYPIHGKLVER
jgi:hypothetical protein